MKNKDFKDLRTKDIKSLTSLVREKRQAEAKKLMEVRSGKEKNLKSVGNFRREIAKILTLIREKEILEKLEADKVKKGSDK